MEKHIYTVTTVHDRKNEDDPWDSRCVGYYFDRQHAIDEVLNNSCDIAECGNYKFTVIEEVPEGLYVTNREEIWFEYNKEKDRFILLDEKPEQFNHTCCYGVG